MKKSYKQYSQSILLIVLILINFLSVNAQHQYQKAMYDSDVNFYEACNLAEQYFSGIDRFKKGSGWNEFMRWKTENEGKYYPTGYRKNVDHYIAQKAYLAFEKNIVSRSSNPTWKDLGPYTADKITQGYNPGIGRIECFVINKNNTAHMYMGSRSGGFWKTTDDGQTWINTTDLLIATGVNTMDANPYNFEEVLINIRNANNGYTQGVYRSLNGGSSWLNSILNPLNNFGGLGKNLSVRVIKYHPVIKDLVFIGTSNGLYRSEDNLKTFTNFLIGSNITDLDFHPIDPKIMYFLVTNPVKKGTLTFSTDTGKTFSTSEVLPEFDGSNGTTGFLDISPKKPNNVYFATAIGNAVYKSNNKGLTFSKVGKMAANGIGNFAISDIDTIHMISGYLNLEGSEDGGLSFTEINRWNTLDPDITYTHADLRAAECIDGVFYIGTDGYFCRSFDNGNTWERLNNGTGVREFYRMGISQSNKDYHIAGSQDNGTSIKDNTSWLEWNGGDGMEAIIHPLEKNIMMGSWQYGSRQLTIDGGLSRLPTSNPQAGSAQADWIAPLLLDPSNHMNVFHFSDSVFISRNFGYLNNWEYVGSPQIGNITHAAIAENNSDLILACRNSNLQISKDKGVKWNSISVGLPNFAIADVAFDPKDDSTIVVCYERYQADSQKLFITHDLGRTWKNITFNLYNMPIRCIAIDHTAEKNIYVGAEIGVFTKPINGIKWELYNTDLPNTTVRELEIQYGSNLLKAVTWGRGLWEVDVKGRETFPKITEVDAGPIIFADSIVPVNIPVHITAKIDYSKKLSQVYVMWSHDNKSLQNRINCKETSITWEIENPIPPNILGQIVYFKIIAVGEHQDTSETYTYMYRQSGCNNMDTHAEIRACKEYTLQNTPITKTGNYTFVFADIYDCDSIVNYDIIIDPEPLTTITKVGNTLHADEAIATKYQWLDCNNNNAKLLNETSRSLNIKKSGSYAVEIEKESCKSVSACVSVIFVNTHTPTNEYSLLIEPNPNSGVFTLKTNIPSANFLIRSLTGTIVYEGFLSTGISPIKTDIPKGLYFVTIEYNSKSYNSKLLIQ